MSEEQENGAEEGATETPEEGDGSEGETLVDPADPAGEENEVEPDAGEE